MANLTTAHVRQYGSNVYELAQQKGSVLRNYVTIEEMIGEKRHFERIKPTTAIRVENKYSDTPLIHTDFDRRTVHGVEYAWADMVDWMDNLNLLIDPTSNIVRVGGYALGRIMDDIIISNAFDGVAYEGKDGLDTVQFPETQKIPVTFGGTGGSSEGLTTPKLIEARSRFGNADIDLDDPENELFIAVTQNQLDDLARSVELGNRDYEAMRDLYEGKTKRFLGFTFVRCGRLPATNVSGGRNRMCAAWCKSGIVLVVPKEIEMSIDRRADKLNNWQAMGKMKAGATRIEDAKVVQIFCHEATA